MSIKDNKPAVDAPIDQVPGFEDIESSNISQTKENQDQATEVDAHQDDAQEMAAQEDLNGSSEVTESQVGITEVDGDENDTKDTLSSVAESADDAVTSSENIDESTLCWDKKAIKKGLYFTNRYEQVQLTFYHWLHQVCLKQLRLMKQALSMSRGDCQDHVDAIGDVILQLDTQICQMLDLPQAQQDQSTAHEDKHDDASPSQDQDGHVQDDQSSIAVKHFKMVDITGQMKYINLTESAIEMLENLCGRLDWQQSGLLAFYRKQIEALSVEFKTFSDDLLSEQKLLLAQQKMYALNVEKKLNELNSIEVYLQLSNQHGQEITAWQRMLCQIDEQSINSLCYEHEKYVRKYIASSEHINNEAYIVIRVPKNAIKDLHAMSGPKADGLGQPLIELRADVLSAHNITFFVHANSHYYDFYKGKLKRHRG